MTKKTFTALELRPRISKVLVGKYDLERVLAESGVSCLQLEIDIAAAIRPLFGEEKKKYSPKTDGDGVFSYIEEAARHDSDLARLIALRLRIETALRKNITDWERGEWAGFDRWLAKRPENETIEGFISWWLSDDFRRKSGTVYLNARKIKENWLQVYYKQNKNEKVEQTASGGYR